MSASASHSPEALAERIHLLRDRPLAALRASFPGMSEEDREDAVSNTLLCAMLKPRAFREAAAQGDADLLCLVRLVARRELRGVWRRPAHQRQASMPMTTDGELLEPPGAVVEPRQDLEVDARRALVRFEALADAAARRYGGARWATLKQAIYESYETDQSASEIAERYGIRREYVSRSRSMIRDGMRKGAPKSRVSEGLRADDGSFKIPRAS